MILMSNKNTKQQQKEDICGYREDPVVAHSTSSSLSFQKVQQIKNWIFIYLFHENFILNYNLCLQINF